MTTRSRIQAVVRADRKELGRVAGLGGEHRNDSRTTKQGATGLAIAARFVSGLGPSADRHP